MKKQGVRILFVFALWALFYAAGIYMGGIVLNVKDGHSIVLGKNFYAGILTYRWSADIAFFSDYEYGFYHGKSVQMDSKPPLAPRTARVDRSIYWGRTAGIYYRYFHFQKGYFWTLQINMWYAVIPLGAISTWIWRRRRLRIRKSDDSDTNSNSGMSHIVYDFTISVFLLFPIVYIARMQDLPRLGYGHGEVTLNSIILLVYGIYCVVVSSMHLVVTHRLWKKNDPRWKKKIAATYGYILLFSLFLAISMMAVAYSELPELFSKIFYNTLAGRIFDSFEELFAYLFGGLVFASLPFLFPIGLILLLLGFSEVCFCGNRPKSYLIITFLASILFSFGGAYPTFLVFIYWMNGGASISYCPINETIRSVGYIVGLI
jgi:hypothetical protein